MKSDDMYEALLTRLEEAVARRQLELDLRLKAEDRAREVEAENRNLGQSLAAARVDLSVANDRATAWREYADKLEVALSTVPTDVFPRNLPDPPDRPRPASADDEKPF